MKNSNIIAKVSTVLVVAILVGFAPPTRAESSVTQSTAPSARLSGKAGTTKRHEFFLNFMLTGSMLLEDENNRLTSYESGALATPGLALRVGGVIDGRHLVGGIFQTNWRSTRKMLDSRGGDGKWGEVANFILGPEYRYQTRFGLYAGGSIGFGYTFGDNSIEDGEGTAPECNTVECLEDYLRVTDDTGVPGVAVRAVVGYEYRIRRNFALNIEGFVGFYDGEDEHNVQMTMTTYGLALGVGI